MSAGTCRVLLIVFLVWPFSLLGTRAESQQAEVRDFDTLILGAELIDGTLSPARKADLGIRGDTIAAIGNLSESTAHQTIDARGLVVAPGFIDMHSHSDFTLLVDGRALSKVTQGVTTELLGESSSAGPVLGATRAERARSLKELGLRLNWETLGDYFQRVVESGIAVNILSTVGAGQIRASVVGYQDRPASQGELQQMERLVEQAMQDGAVGLSSGLIYPPNSYASTEELISLARVAGRYGGIYLTHIRGEDDRLLEAVREAIEIGLKANLPVEILHFKRSSVPLNRTPEPSIMDAINVIERARRLAIDVGANLYPYSASQTSLSTRFPSWVREGGREKMLARLRDPDSRQRIRQELGELFSHGIGGITPETILFGATSYEPHRHFQGKKISEIAQEMDVNPAEVFLELVDKSGGDAAAIFFSMREEDMRYALRLPWTSIGSDGTAVSPEGVLARSHPHPRWYGSFPRILGRYVRQESLLTLEEAIRKMTALPAARLGLHDRGLLAEGYRADIVAFDPRRIIDRADFENPHQLSEGVDYLWVNGTLVLKQGKPTNALPGRVLRPKWSSQERP